MWKRRAVTLCGCLAALPLLMGCANGVSGPFQGYAPPQVPAAAAADSGGARVYAVGPGAPAAILVMLPGGPGDMLSGNPQLWTRQGFDVMAPPAPELYQTAAEEQAVAARLVAQARALANAPIWLVGPNPAVGAAMPPSGPGGVSGVVVTSTTSGAGSCSERMIYSYSGNGAPPKVSVSRSGDACPAGSPFGAGTNPAVAPPMPMVRPNAPRLIEATAPSAGGAPVAVREVAELIKSASPD